MMLAVPQSLGGPPGLARGRVLAVVGAKGGCGSSMVALNLAAAIEPPESVCVLDLEFTRGDLLGFLDLPSRGSIREAVEAGARLDTALLRGSVTVHPAGFSFLGQPYDLRELLRVDAREVGHLLRVATEGWPVVVADCGANVDEAFLGALCRADRVLVVTTAAITSLRDAVRLLALLRSVGVAAERVDVVVNRWRSDESLSIHDIGERLGHAPLALLPEDEKSCRAAEEDGRLLRELSPGSRLVREIARVASVLSSSLSTTMARSPA